MIKIFLVKIKIFTVNPPAQGLVVNHPNIHHLRTSSLPGAIMDSHREDENYQFLLLGFIITIIIAMLYTESYTIEIGDRTKAN